MKKNFIDLHTHSVLSGHAYSSVTENLEYASSIGLKVYGISEHQPDKVGVGAHKFVFNGLMRILPKEFNNTKVLVGIELNILDNGFDLDGIHPENLSYAIASMHGYVYPRETHTLDDNTRNYIRACETDFVTFLGHLDYPSYPCDYEKVVMACKKNDKLIELNNASLDPNGSRVGAREIDKTILEYCKKYSVPIILNSDAHIKYQIGNVDTAIELLDEIKFPEELVVNFNDDLFNHYFKYR